MHNRMFLLLVASLVAFAGVARVNANTPTTLPVWPTTAPGEPSGIGPEHMAPVTPKNPVDRIADVTVPTLTLFPAAPDKNTGAVVLICPGGAYKILAFDLEGTEIAGWLNSIGVNAIVLKYRVPARSGLPAYLPPLQDAQRAMSIVRKNAADWKIDPHRIGILGFSAGGNLSARISTNYDQRAYPPIDDIDTVSCRPDFTVLILSRLAREREEGWAHFRLERNSEDSADVHRADDG